MTGSDEAIKVETIEEAIRTTAESTDTDAADLRERANAIEFVDTDIEDAGTNDEAVSDLRS